MPQGRVVRLGGPALPYDPTYHLLLRLDKWTSLCQAEHPDVVEIHSPYMAALGALSVPRRCFGIRTFVWHADFIDTYFRGPLERTLPPRSVNALLEAPWAWVRTIAKGCDATFAAGQHQVEKLKAHGVPRVRCLPFGVDKQVFAPDAASRMEPLRELRSEGPEGAPILLAVGRFAIEKRWDVVVDAFLQLAKERPAQLVLYGDGPERKALETRAQGHPWVRFMGFEKDPRVLAAAMASADLLVHGCPYETFGLGVAEALCAGLPAVVPDQGGAAEQIREGHGLHYRALDAQQCVEALRAALAKPREEWREGVLQARQRILSMEEAFSNLAATYDELLRARREETTTDDANRS